MDIKSLRDKINNIDVKLVSILNQRAKISQQIGHVKKSSSKAIYAPAREQEVLSNAKKLNKGPLSNDSLEAVYREIMSGSLSLEKMSNIAYLGTEGSFTHMAAKKRFGTSVKYNSSSSILDVFQKVEHDDCDYGVVPIENSIEGVVTHTVDLLADSDLKICSQVMLKVSHCLMSSSVVPLDKIKKVYSHPQVFGQCKNWLSQNLNNIGQVWVPSTSEGAQLSKKDKGSVAIASREAAKLYKLKVLKENIQDIAHNTTRFLVISKQDVPPTGRDRTSILFSIKDKMGALHDMLLPFYKNKINLTKIESRPSKKVAWDYYFFVDCEGHRNDKNVKKALAELEDMCKYLKVLGSYPISK